MEDYQLLLRLGAGSFAVVWKARRISDGSIVAVKQLKDTSLSWEDVVNMPEIKHVQDLDHSNILKTLSVVRLGCTTFIILEYCEINVLQVMNTMMASGKRFTEPEIRWIMRQCLRGLSYMHSHGVLHRDIKPENMLLQSGINNGGVPGLKLCDFGQAKNSSAATFTDYVATRWYRAPELLLHAARYDGGVDIFAAGVMMAELFTLRPVFAGTSEMDQLFRIASTMGSFTAADWPEGARLASMRGFHLPEMRRVGMSTLLPGVSPQALQAIEAMLTWNPSRRPTADQLLLLPFFRESFETAPKFATSGLRLHEEALAKAEADAAQASLESMIKELREGSPVAVKPVGPAANESGLVVDSVPSRVAIAPTVPQARVAPPGRRGAVNPFADSASGVEPLSTQSANQSSHYAGMIAPSVAPASTATPTSVYGSAYSTTEAKGSGAHSADLQPKDCGYSPSVQDDDSLYSLGGLNLPMYGRRPYAVQGGSTAGRKFGTPPSVSNAPTNAGALGAASKPVATPTDHNGPTTRVPFSLTSSMPAPSPVHTSVSAYQPSLSAFSSSHAAPLPAASGRGPTNWLADFLDDDVGALETPDD